MPARELRHQLGALVGLFLLKMVSLKSAGRAVCLPKKELFDSS